MASQLPAAPEFWQPDDKQQHSALFTAQILAQFQYREANRMPQATTCNDACKTQLASDCFAECELPFTAECTDGCVVVCEEPHDEDEDDCCETNTVCQSSDCQYSNLDHGCCMGCPDESDLAVKTPQGFFHDSYGMTQPFGDQYLQEMPNYGSGHVNTNVSSHGCDLWSSECQSSLAFSHCNLPCSVNTFNDYGLTPASSITQSTAGSPWSFQSPVTSAHGSQSHASQWSDGENRLSLLAASSVNDYKAFENYQGSPSYLDSFGQTNHPNAYDTAMLGMPFQQPTQSQPKHRHAHSISSSQPSECRGNDTKSTRRMKAEQLDYFSELQCRWLVIPDESQEMCLCKFNSREALHAHILDAHIKSLKKKSASSPSQFTEHPICRWHGCESARRKKVFKLQHLKDHIVCHSKLRMKCSICNKECRDAKVLKIHMNSHKPGQEKPFRCDFDTCTASFGTSALLSSHKRVHTGEKPHKCAYCEYRAADKGNLRRHEEEMHIGRKWPCPYCAQQLAKKANLTRHIRDLHAAEHARRQIEPETVEAA